MFKNRVCNVYFTDTHMFYVLYKDKAGKKLSSGVFEFTADEVESMKDKRKRVLVELDNMKKVLNGAEFNIVPYFGHRLTRVVNLKEPIKAAKELELFLRAEMSKVLPTGENLNDYDLGYMKDKKDTNSLTYLVSLMSKRVMSDLCSIAINKNVRITRLIPSMLVYYEYLSQKRGLNILLDFNSSAKELQIIATLDAKPIHAVKFTDFFAGGLMDEVKNLIPYIEGNVHERVSTLYCVGDVPIEELSELLASTKITVSDVIDVENLDMSGYFIPTVLRG